MPDVGSPNLYATVSLHSWWLRLLPLPHHMWLPHTFCTLPLVRFYIIYGQGLVLRWPRIFLISVYITISFISDTNEHRLSYQSLTGEARVGNNFPFQTTHIRSYSGSPRDWWLCPHQVILMIPKGKICVMRQWNVLGRKRFWMKSGGIQYFDCFFDFITRNRSKWWADSHRGETSFTLAFSLIGIFRLPRIFQVLRHRWWRCRCTSCIGIR